MNSAAAKLTGRLAAAQTADAPPAAADKGGSKQGRGDAAADTPQPINMSAALATYTMEVIGTSTFG